MAKYREVVCLHYIALGQCKKGRDACHEHYCQKCDKYEPRAKSQNTNRKKKEVQRKYKMKDITEYKKKENY